MHHRYTRKTVQSAMRWFHVHTNKCLHSTSFGVTITVKSIVEKLSVWQLENCSSSCNLCDGTENEVSKNKVRIALNGASSILVLVYLFVYMCFWFFVSVLCNGTATTHKRNDSCLESEGYIFIMDYR